MSKPDREQRLRDGAARLQEWGLPADASIDVLRDHIGRGTASDLAIAERLGARAEQASVDVLSALESASTDKLVRKEVHRSLYRLAQRGLTAAHAPSPPPQPRIAA